ncbi:MAG: hypothetical protein KF835_06265 [Xanthobacteraceae bacterium]|nr:hypothetical protein [Xanthobacteraceae bacterium]
MAEPVHTAFTPSSRPLLIGAAAFFGALAAVAGFMWSWFGTKIFFDMVAAGIAACF